jgi:hypothetical protein
MIWEKNKGSQIRLAKERRLHINKHQQSKPEEK